MKHWGFRLKLGVAITLFFLLLGFLLPVFCPIGNVMEWGAFFKNIKPNPTHIFGTTATGQDIFWLLTISVRNSLIIGITAASLVTIIGVFLGLFAGLVGGAVDRAICLIMDTLISMPILPILILFASLTNGRAPWYTLAFVIVAFNWPWPGRQARAMALYIRENDFINVARFSGEGSLKIILFEIFPFVSNWSIANFANAVLAAIGMESGLAIVGMANNNMATLGTMIYWANNRQALLSRNYFWIGSPVMATVVLFVGLFLVMTGMQERSTSVRGK